jgi:hypothetical protein
MNSSEGISPEIAQLDLRLNKVFKGYSGIRLTRLILAIIIGASWLMMLVPGIGNIPVLSGVLMSLSYPAFMGFFVLYFVALGFVIAHGRVMKAYARALEGSGEEPTGMYLRGQAGLKEAKRLAVRLGIAVASPLMFMALFVLVLLAYHHP